ncbi:MAG: glycosyltransferase family 2 protein [Anaerolineales bacterium]|jgi:glycosyltransferase involved in cell wall biosynthesis|nr:glycosyltransferase family 2 protein [Anaerolineales bacterium]
MFRRIAIFIPEASPHIAQWGLGEVVRYPPDLSLLVSCVNDWVIQPELDAILFWDPNWAVPEDGLILSLLASPDDLWHAGLKLGMGGRLGLLDFAAPTWMFNRDPAPETCAASWRVSLKACLVRAEVIRQVGFLNPSFISLEAAALEWGFRCMRRGVFCRNQPDLLPGINGAVRVTLPAADELRFILNGYGKSWAAWALGRAWLSGYFSVRQVVQAARSLKGESQPLKPAPFFRAPQPTPELAAPPAISVIIPTLERYPYLAKLLEQLRQQTLPAAEILIIDQTPVSLRQEQVYTETSDLPLRVIFQDQPGQCSSRNAGLQSAQGDLILFIDDDDEVPVDLLEKHILNIRRFQADASCGVALEAGAGPLPEAFTYLRTSDVFPTNNSLVRYAALKKSGFFDLAYERGARADADLGMRLYLSGARMVLEPAVEVLHHHAPRGGLRAHKARVITYASSRQRLFHRHLPAPTELYLARRYFSERQVREMKWISLFATFSLHGSKARRVLKFIAGFLMLPSSLYQLYQNELQAKNLLQMYPEIPMKATHEK